MITNFKQWDSYWNNFNNGDEALFQDASLPRDTFWFKIKNWIQTSKLDFWSWVSGFYLDQVSAIWGKEIAWASQLIDTIIPLGLWTKALKWLPFSTYWTSLEALIWDGNWWYTRWNLNWRISKDWWIIIPTSWSYFIDFYWEVYFDSTQWQTSYMITLFKWNEPRSRESKVNASNPDSAWKTTLLDLKSWDIVYLGWAHASASWKKALYIWWVTIFKLS